MKIKEKEARKRLFSGPADSLDAICERFMAKLRQDFHGQKAEISPHMLTKYAKRFHVVYGISENQLLDALMRRGWIEPSAADTWLIRYDLVRK